MVYRLTRFRTASGESLLVRAYEDGWGVQVHSDEDRIDPPGHGVSPEDAERAWDAARAAGLVPA